MRAVDGAIDYVRLTALYDHTAMALGEMALFLLVKSPLVNNGYCDTKPHQTDKKRTESSFVTSPSRAHGISALFEAAYIQGARL